MTPKTVTEVRDTAKTLRARLITLHQEIKRVDLKTCSLETIQEIRRDISACQVYAQACNERITDAIRKEGLIL